MLRRVVHSLFQPWVVALLFLLGFTAWTRLAHLGSVPTSLNWDEAALGYVGKMVVTTGRDEYNQFLPRVFQSFGDYKAPLAFYFTGISTTLFGLHAWSVRLPFALTGIASIGAMVWVAYRVLNNRWIALAAGWLLAVLPWHLLFSRVGFESGVSLLFLITLWGSWLELRRIQKPHPVWWGVGVLSAIVSVYTYHAARLVVPLTLILIAAYELVTNRDWVQKNIRQIGFSIVACVVLGLPLLFTLRNHGAERAAQTSVFAQENSISQGSIRFVQNTFAHMSLRFLVLGETTTLRHGTGENGVFLYSHFVLFAFGLAFIAARSLEQYTHKRSHSLWTNLHRFIKAKFASDETHLVGPWIWGAFFVIGLLPAGLGFEVPHANRALLAAPAAILIMSFTFKEALRDLTKIAFALLIGMLILFSLLEFSRFWHSYLTTYRTASASEWLAGYPEAARLAWEAKLAGKRVKFTSAYGQPEIFFAFANNLPFDTYRWQRIPGIEFGHIGPFDEGNYDLLIAGEKEPLSSHPTRTINRPDGTPAFFVYER